MDYERTVRADIPGSFEHALSGSLASCNFEGMPDDIGGYYRLVWMPKQIRIIDVIKDVATSRKVSVADIRGHCRRAHIVNARQEAMYEAKRVTGRNLTEISRVFRCDRTSVAHGVDTWPKKAAALGIECKPLEVGR